MFAESHNGLVENELTDDHEEGEPVVDLLISTIFVG